ncbi:MAG: PBP1A family penicillin-binding protein [Deltaproteobacteria bacterium]|nr:PBP1A family penicillin-binding protein [Deltaproteobacteria bacterium]
MAVLKWTAFIFGAMGLLAANAAAGAFFWFSKDLPPLSSIRDYRPKAVTEVHDRHGRIFARFFEERRTPKPLSEMPPMLLKAIIAAEDADFYKHKGTDWLGLVRAAWRNIASGKVRQGASTITEQTVKTFLLSPERTVTRRLKAMLLAWRLEKNFTKDEILSLYLNQIYFGHGNYGVAEAARFFFGKDLAKLNVEECAMIAALPQGPELLSPYRHFERLKTRQLYVLGEMHKNGFLTKEQHEAARKAPLKIVFHRGEDPAAGPRRAETSRDYYAEHVRLLLVSRFGQEAVMQQGLRVETSVDSAAQDAAVEALDAGLREVDRRQGYRGPVAHLEPASAETLAKAAREKVWTAKGNSARRATVLGCADPLSSARMGFRLKERAEIPKDPAAFKDAIEAAPIRKTESFLGIVSKVDAEGVRVFTGLGDSVIPFETFAWARKFSPAKWTPGPKSAGEIFKSGDVVLLRPVEPKVLKDPPRKKGKKEKKEKETPVLSAGTQEFELDQEPLVQGALVAIDPATRDVVAMVGGDEFAKSPFNRVTQAKRQPGSAFKPVIYSLAIASKKYTPLTLVSDSPFVYRDPQTAVEWKPENFDSEKNEYEGLIPLRDALAKSKNVVSARMVQDLGVEAVAAHARKLGIASELPKYLSLSLGAGEVTPLELAGAYATIADGGKRAEPVFVKTVREFSGRVLWQFESAKEQVLDPAAAFVTIDMMRGVVERGTAVRAKALGRPAAGKTGTTNEGRDTWFGGFTPDMLALVYIGFDDHAPMGWREQGGRTAVPIWLSFMQKAQKGKPVEQFTAPPGVVYALVDPATGALAVPGSEAAEKAVFQPFVPGTEPTESAPLRPAEDFWDAVPPAPDTKQ